MKKLLLLSPLLLSLASCGQMDRMIGDMNQSTYNIQQNRAAIEQGTQAVLQNAALIEQATKGIEENHRLIREAAGG